MPMHDWTRVEPGIYHHFHNMWLQAIVRALNNGLLPPSYYALVEQVTMSSEADLLALKAPTENGVSHRPRHSEAGHAEPAVALLERAERPIRKEKPRSRIAVRHVSNHRVVAVIELLSPGNKAGVRVFNQFVAKAIAILDSNVNFFLVDPFPPSPRDPNGIHEAIWSRIVDVKKRGRKRFSLPPKKRLTAASYCAGTEDMIAAVEPFAIGDPVPDMPLFLTPEEDYVTVPLEATYKAAWPDVPKVWREVLAR
jgi:hypothetical protein